MKWSKQIKINFISNCATIKMNTNLAYIDNGDNHEGDDDDDD